MSAAELRRVRELPCCLAEVDGRHCLGPVQAHHPKQERAGAKLKTADASCLPMCVEHHRQFHDLHGHFKGWTRERLRAWQREMVGRFRQGKKVNGAEIF